MIEYLGNVSWVPRQGACQPQLSHSFEGGRGRLSNPCGYRVHGTGPKQLSHSKAPRDMDQAIADVFQPASAV